MMYVLIKYASSNLKPGDYVVQQSRTNLTKKGKNVSKGLYNSIKNEVVSDP
jgi:hypothetical protein